MNTFDERNLLKLSIVATLIIASLGIALGLLSGSFSIAFDGSLFARGCVYDSAGTMDIQSNL